MEIYGVFKCNLSVSLFQEAFLNKEDAEKYAEVENKLHNTFSAYHGIQYVVKKLEVKDHFVRNDKQKFPERIPVGVCYVYNTNKLQATVLDIKIYNPWFFDDSRKDMIRVLTKVSLTNVDIITHMPKWENRVSFIIYIPYNHNFSFMDYCHAAKDCAEIYDEKYRELISNAKRYSPFGLIEDLHFKPERLEESLALQKIVKKLTAIKNTVGYTSCHKHMSIKGFADIDLFRSEVEDQSFYLEIERG